MTTIELNKKETKEASAYYLDEKIRLESKLDHVNVMLAKLGGTVPIAPIKKLTVTKKLSKPKKRGPKRSWGDFIVKRLRARNKPMSYSDLIDDAMAIHKLPENRVSAARASILNSAFRLRKVHGKIKTIGRAGKKEKLLVLTKWLQKDGELQPEYSKAFKKMQGGKAERVNMSAIQISSDVE